MATFRFRGSTDIKLAPQLPSLTAPCSWSDSLSRCAAALLDHLAAPEVTPETLCADHYERALRIAKKRLAP